MSAGTDSAAPRIIVALDFPEPDAALALADRLDPALCRLKVGKELFTRSGPALATRLMDRGFSVFLDLKFHDIPNTVAAACAAAADLGVWMVNVHALGGPRMMAAARDAVSRSNPATRLIAVTVLTSMDDDELAAVGINGPPEATVRRLARLAHEAGLDGVVCSPMEAAALRQERGEDFLLVTPGVRPATAQSDDQRRIATPAAARRAGSDYLVIGRPITRAADPAQALADIAAELD